MEIVIDLYELGRNNADRSGTFYLVSCITTVMPYKATVQYHDKDIGIGTVKSQNISITTESLTLSFYSHMRFPPITPFLTAGTY